MSRLFVSYNYVTKDVNGVIYTGFSNCTLVRPEPTTEIGIESMRAMIDNHCRESLGMAMASTTIIWWKVL